MDKTPAAPGYDEQALCAAERETGYDGDGPAEPCDFCDRAGVFVAPDGSLLCVKHEEVYWRHVNSKIDAARGK